MLIFCVSHMVDYWYNISKLQARCIAVLFCRFDFSSPQKAVANSGRGPGAGPSATRRRPKSLRADTRSGLRRAVRRPGQRDPSHVKGKNGQGKKQAQKKNRPQKKKKPQKKKTRSKKKTKTKKSIQLFSFFSRLWLRGFPLFAHSEARRRCNTTGAAPRCATRAAL